MKRITYLTALLILFSSCASKYNPITIDNLNYRTDKKGSDIEYAVNTNVLMEFDNNKYANKALKKDVSIIAIELTNHTDKTLDLDRDLQFLSGNNPINPVDMEVAHSLIKQPAGLYWLWGLLWASFSSCDNNDCSYIPIPIGLLIGGINSSKANKANGFFLDKLTQDDLLQKEVKSGETVRGLLCIKRNEMIGLSIQLKQ